MQLQMCVKEKKRKLWKQATSVLSYINFMHLKFKNYIYFIND